MKKILSIIALVSLFYIGCNCMKSEVTLVQAIVTNKEYIESDFNYWKGKFRRYGYFPGYFPEKYDVTVQYNDIVETLDNKSLYETVEIGTKVDVKLKTYYWNGRILQQFISFD